MLGRTHFLTGLVAAEALILRAPQLPPAVLLPACIGTAVGTLLPDLDKQGSYAARTGITETVAAEGLAKLGHRGPTHSIAAAGLAAAGLYLGGRLFDAILAMPVYRYLVGHGAPATTALLVGNGIGYAVLFAVVGALLTQGLKAVGVSPNRTLGAFRLGRSLRLRIRVRPAVIGGGFLAGLLYGGAGAALLPLALGVGGGMLLHDLADGLNREGAAYFWPLTRRHFRILPLFTTGTGWEYLFDLGVVMLGVLLVLAGGAA